MKDHYRYHCENLKMIERAISTVQHDLKRYIAIESKNEIIYTKLLSHLINAWAEVRILKLIYEEGAFTTNEIDRIEDAGSIEERWKLALNIAFMRAYNIQNEKEIDDVKYSVTSRQRRKFLISLIEHDLLESFQVRNRIAHGQWLYGFNNDLSDINEDITRKLRTENYLTLKYRLLFFKSLSQIIHDLAVSKNTFERDFDNNYRKIEAQKKDYENRDYVDYKEYMIEKKKRGLKYKPAKK